MTEGKTQAVMPLSFAEIISLKTNSIPEAAAKEFFAYCFSCLRYDAEAERFVIWDNGEWEKDLAKHSQHSLLRTIFKDWLTSKLKFLTKENDRLMNLNKANPYVLYQIDSEYSILRGWHSQKCVPEIVVRFLRSHTVFVDDNTPIKGGILEEALLKARAYVDNSTSISNEQRNIKNVATNT